MTSIKTFTIIAALVVIAVPADAVAGKKLDPKQKLAWEAAEALYGRGLKIKRSRSAVTIKPGKLTQARFDTYVRDVYLPALQRVPAWGHLSRWRPKYRDKKWAPQGPIKYGYLLLEPAYKFALCKAIADKIAFVPNMEAHAKRKTWCAYQAIIEAFTPIFEYRGVAVTWKGKRSRGDLKVDDEIFKADASGHYPIVVTVAGAREVMSKRGLSIATKMSGALSSDFAPKLYRKAIKLWKSKVKRYHKFEKKILAKQLKLAPRRVLFAEEHFSDWLAIPGAKGTISCEKSFVLAYAPRRARRDGYQLIFNVDGRECMSLPLVAKERESNDFYTTATCRRLLKKGSTHTLTVNLHYNINTGTYKRVVLDKGKKRFKKRTFNLSKRGKKIYGASIKCKY